MLIDFAIVDGRRVLLRFPHPTRTVLLEPHEAAAIGRALVALGHEVSKPGLVDIQAVEEIVREAARTVTLGAADGN